MKKILLLLLTLFTQLTFSQVAVNTDGSSANASAMLDVKSSDKGLLIPRMTTSQREAITSPATGLLVFDSDKKNFYFYTGTAWTLIKSGTVNWELDSIDLTVTDTTYRVGIGTSNPEGKLEVVTLKHNATYGTDRCTGGTASASSHYTSYTPDRAFDDNTSTEWVNNNILPTTLQYDFGAGNDKRIAKYRIYYQHPSSYDHSPSDWTFEASDDGTTWKVLDTQTSQGWSAGGWKDFTFANTTLYRYYRFNITDNKGAADNYVQINEVEMIEENLSNHVTLMVNDNKVGIGTASPEATVDILGSMKYSDGNEGAGKIMVSDAAGNASWTAGSAVNAGGWTHNGNYIYTASDSVGLGTSSPEARLTVNGRISQTGTGYSVFLGEQAGAGDDLSDNYNTFIGYYAGKDNSTGQNNCAMGDLALRNNTTGSNNTAIGNEALHSNTTGGSNVAIGSKALYNSTTQWYNIAIGDSALYHNSTGGANTAIGSMALYSNTSSDYNTALGENALHDHTVGGQNTAIGVQALFADSSGYFNTALGYAALNKNKTGYENTALGSHSMDYFTTGYQNTVVGSSAMHNIDTGNYNTALGSSSFVSGFSLYSYFNSTALGYASAITANNQVRIGDNNVTSIGGYANWTNLSDKRFKRDVRDNVPGLDFILKLKPVTYHLDLEKLHHFLNIPDSVSKADDFKIESMKKKEAMVQTGFLAQDVEKAAQAVGYDFSGVDKPKNEHDFYGLRYAEFVVPLVKAVQELSEENEKMKSENEMLKKRLERIEYLLEKNNRR